MTTHVKRGHFTRNIVGLAVTSGDRVECIAIAPWLYRVTLEHIMGYWEGDFARHATPARAVLESFR
jgi:hypothetical protein